MNNRFLQFILGMCLFAIGAFAQGNRILVIAPKGPGFIDAVRAMQANLSDMVIQQVAVTESESNPQIAIAITQFQPNMVALLDNKAIRQYKSYLKSNPANASTPVIALMALQMDAMLSDMPQAIGISYELPAVTTVSRLRGLVQVPIHKVGVIYRSSMEKFFQQNRKFCEVEKIQLIGYQVADNSNMEMGIKDGLYKLISEQKVDALWIVNDNQLLTAKTILGSWLPALKSSPRPTIVGVESLVQTKLNFGMYAALPDPEGLGAQAANIVYEIMDSGWKVESSRVDQPLSVIQILNIPVGSRITKLKNDASKQVDKTIE